MEYHRGSPLIVAGTLYLLSLQQPCVWPPQVPTTAVRQPAVGQQTPSDRVSTAGLSPDTGSVRACWGPRPGKKRVYSPSGDPNIIFPNHGWPTGAGGWFGKFQFLGPRQGFHSHLSTWGTPHIPFSTTYWTSLLDVGRLFFFGQPGWLWGFWRWPETVALSVLAISALFGDVSVFVVQCVQHVQ